LVVEGLISQYYSQEFGWLDPCVVTCNETR